MSSSFQVVHPVALFKREKKTERETEWKERYIQISSVTQSCLTLCDPMDCSMPGLPIHHQFLEFTQTHIHSVGDAIQTSHSVVPFSSCFQSFPAPGSFQMSQFFTSGGQSIGVSASASVPSSEYSGLISLGWTGWISLQSKGVIF